ncbi:MAG: hypothetical protein ABSG15_12790 [FCB group bacterium]|jgi:uncharacterized protein YeeX (DUF496 family)
MKTSKVILIVYFIACMNIFAQSDNSKYLELTVSQLKDLGFVINTKGIFFKTEIPPEDSKKLYECMRGYYNTKVDEGTRYVMGYDCANTEDNSKNKENPSYYDKLPALKCDYYFVKIVEINGDTICSVEPHKTLAIPIIVRQEKYKFKIKKDIIVYLKATEGLKKKLNYVDNLEQYIVSLTD